MEAPGRGRRAGGGHTSTAGLARQPLQNQEQMAGRFPDPSFGSDCLGEKGFKLPGRVKGSHFPLENGEKQNCLLNRVVYLCLGEARVTFIDPRVG